MAANSKNQRKYGRNAAFCKAYKISNRREKNKIKKLSRHLDIFPQDQIALSALERNRKIVRGY